MKKLSIICWNVNGIRAWSKKGCFDWFLKENPDFFCIQETKAHPEQLTSDILSPNGYTSYFDHSRTRKGYSGVAIYTKTKPEKIDYALGVPELDQEGRFIALHFKEFVLITCYFPNGGGGPIRLKYKLEYYKEFLKYITKLHSKGKKVIFCGDVNTAHTEIDLARPKENQENTGFLPIERAWIDKVVNAGFIDAYRHLNPNQVGAYTYWDMKTFARERNVGWRIDYFFLSPDLRDSVIDCKILSDVYGSDHCPIKLEVKL